MKRIKKNFCMLKHPKISIIIPTLNRIGPLQDCLASIYAQSYKDFEVITVTEEGPLAKIRNLGAVRARGDILTFIDDDVVCDRHWLKNIMYSFECRKVAGVSGPCIIKHEFRRNRDIFRFKRFKSLHDHLFLGSERGLPGHITSAGAWTTGASEETDYEGSVQFLEACNMSFEKDAFWKVGGFDDAYKGIGDWSEPDICFKIRKNGGLLWFSKLVRLEHRPSKSGAFNKRKEQAMLRLKNYDLFSKRWVTPCFRHSLYKLFLRGYYVIKTIG